ncbi:MAG: hypothetical protein Kow0031_37530 [Anaerolineae bacterium]
MFIQPSSERRIFPGVSIGRWSRRRKLHPLEGDLHCFLRRVSRFEFRDGLSREAALQLAESINAAKPVAAAPEISVSDMQ